MAEEKIEKKEAKVKEEPAAPNYAVWHPDHRLNHIYMADGKKVVWTMKSGAEKPSLKVVD
jgi:hypothetical protein